MDNAKLFHFDKKALRDECIKRGDIIDDQIVLLKTMRAIVSSMDLSKEGKDLIASVNEAIRRARL